MVVTVTDRDETMENVRCRSSRDDNGKPGDYGFGTIAKIA